ncbi:MAG: NYN domain-containing protein [bacterium]|nr:NYN domain-containing protein [bacterium]
MKWIIDGNNVLGVHKDKNWIPRISQIQNLISSSNALGEVIIVFDGSSIPYLPKKNVRVVFTNSQQAYDSADDYIIQILQDNENATVVTDDVQLKNRVQAKGVKTMSNAEFKQLIKRKTTPKPRSITDQIITDGKEKLNVKINSKQILEELIKPRPRLDDD